jgi:hypothetical protein
LEAKNIKDDFFIILPSVKYFKTTLKKLNKKKNIIEKIIEKSKSIILIT